MDIGFRVATMDRTANKGRSSRILRQEFPHLRDWCEDHLWAHGCYHGSVGQGWEVVEKYISTQNCTSGEKAL